MYIGEGISGIYFYHLVKEGEFISLCGAKVMSTQIPHSYWGTKSHLEEKWCNNCYEISQED